MRQHLLRFNGTYYFRYVLSQNLVSAFDTHQHREIRLSLYTTNHIYARELAYAYWLACRELATSDLHGLGVTCVETFKAHVRQSVMNHLPQQFTPLVELTGSTEEKFLTAAIKVLSAYHANFFVMSSPNLKGGILHKYQPPSARWPKGVYGAIGSANGQVFPPLQISTALINDALMCETTDMQPDMLYYTVKDERFCLMPPEGYTVHLHQLFVKADLPQKIFTSVRKLTEKPVAVAASAAEVPKPTPKMSQVFDDYIKVTQVANKWRPETLKSRKQAATLLVDFLDDSPIGNVTRQMMTDAYLLLPRMPNRFDKRYPKLTPKAAIAAADKVDDADRISPKTCNLRLEVWKALFKFASDHDVIAKSPTDHLKAFAEDNAQDARDAFDDSQLLAFFRLLKSEINWRPEHYWIARVMAYEGFRLEEAAALRRCDVREIDGVWCVEVSAEASETKTENSPRILPIHSALLEDLKAYVGTRDGDPKANLWGLELGTQGKWSHALSKRMNNRLRKAIAGKSKKLVVESTRNTFATRLKAVDVQEHVISELMGHAVGNLAVGRYGKKLDVVKLRGNLERLKLPSL